MSRIVGTWRLVRAAATDASGKPSAPPYGGATGKGLVTFGTDGRMLCVLCDGRPTLPPGEVREYNSYCGNYSFDGKTLITKVDACSDPGRLAVDQVRDVRFEGSLMILRPPLRRNGSATQQRELTWERISDV